MESRAPPSQYSINIWKHKHKTYQRNPHNVGHGRAQKKKKKKTPARVMSLVSQYGILIAVRS